MNLSTDIHYRRYRGWSGKIYYVQMTEAEVKAREKIKLIASILITVPAMIIIMALAAGMI